VQPDILIKASDYKPEDIVGYDVVKAKGGEVITLDFLPGYSTTTIIEKLSQLTNYKP
jgi:bifunctional ADP-heptose synthase (sugar kinase/adenylyltransferase)